MGASGRMLEICPFLHPLEAVSHWAGGCLSLTLDIFTAPVHEASPLVSLSEFMSVRRGPEMLESKEGRGKLAHVQPLVQELDSTSHAAQPKDR